MSLALTLFVQLASGGRVHSHRDTFHISRSQRDGFELQLPLRQGRAIGAL